MAESNGAERSFWKIPDLAIRPDVWETELGMLAEPSTTGTGLD